MATSNWLGREQRQYVHYKSAFSCNYIHTYGRGLCNASLPQYMHQMMTRATIGGAFSKLFSFHCSLNSNWILFLKNTAQLKQWEYDGKSYSEIAIGADSRAKLLPVVWPAVSTLRIVLTELNWPGLNQLSPNCMRFAIWRMSFAKSDARRGDVN